jgi:hypothetical protein
VCSSDTDNSGLTICANLKIIVKMREKLHIYIYLLFVKFHIFSADVHSILPIKKDRLVVAFSRQSLGIILLLLLYFHCVL